MHSDINTDYSIVICTYNPDERLLSRCLEAVARLDRAELNVEVILIDNNSPIALETLPYVQTFVNRIEGIRIIVVEEQGLTPSRMAAIRAAKGKYIVFFDDDNDADSDYLQELASLNNKYKEVVAWGPGHISVDFIDGISPDIERYARSVFQERHDVRIEYANTVDWQRCYPFGTGMCVETSILKAYEKLVGQGRFTLPDRKGNQLSSGGDVQIILYCLSIGNAAGVSPGLKMKHIIPAKRANAVYIGRLLYGAFVGGSVCTLEVFPEHKQVLLNTILSPDKFSRRALKGYFKLLLKKSPLKTFEFITYLGTTSAVYLALNRPVPSAVNWVIKKLNLG